MPNTLVGRWRWYGGSTAVGGIFLLVTGVILFLGARNNIFLQMYVLQPLEAQPFELGEQQEQV